MAMYGDEECLDASACNRANTVASNTRRYRHWLPRSPIGRSGPPAWNHASLQLACINLVALYGIYPGAAVGERRRARGLGASVGWLRVGGAQVKSAIRAKGTPELRERSASAPQVRMRCDHNLGDCACPCEGQTSTLGDSFRNSTA
eukprot:6186569-Pleurochrysis_carterae.AAC.1